MAEGFITRRGGVAAIERTASPSINFVSKTESQIVVTFTNAEANEVDIFYGITSTLTDKVTVAASGTSSNVTFSGLDQNTPYTVSAYAIVTNATLKKIKSEIISTSITTDAAIYTAATGGTTLEYNESGKRYKSHTFNSSGNFVVSQVGNGNRNQVDYLVIAGGAGGAGGIGGGGGAGGYRTTNGTSGGNSSAESKVTVTATTFGITIGGGGAGGGGNQNGVSGSNTSALGITSTGGGFGSRNINAGGGGSGGGTRGVNGVGPGNGISGQGFRGGTTSGTAPGTGGGGASETGTDITSSTASKGGDGLANTIKDGTSETRAGGGGGGGGAGTPAGAGGAGGGGAGSVTTAAGGSGATNTGGGGGGGAFASNGDRPGGPGGSGIVIIRYEIAPSA